MAVTRTTTWNARIWLALAAMSGFLSVAVGAFAAHVIADPEAANWLRTGATYAFMHALATIGCATFIRIGAVRARHAPPFFLWGTLFFSGSLYAMAAGAPRWLGAVTPVGGVLFLIGWSVLAWAASGAQAD